MRQESPLLVDYWLRGAYWGENHWVLADKFILARRVGKVDRSLYHISDSDHHRPDKATCLHVARFATDIDINFPLLQSISMTFAVLICFLFSTRFFEGVQVRLFWLGALPMRCGDLCSAPDMGPPYICERGSVSVFNQWIHNRESGPIVQMNFD
ncbi:hypothetical protein B0H14DRAFT_2578532 [Mycena olivaceomarginata]|nr:hypothetical protein B0H14DRAFT_2578532 [Mycena olivaceomarginata]